MSSSTCNTHASQSAPILNSSSVVKTVHPVTSSNFSSIKIRGYPTRIMEPFNFLRFMQNVGLLSFFVTNTIGFIQEDSTDIILLAFNIRSTVLFTMSTHVPEYRLIRSKLQLVRSITLYWSDIIEWVRDDACITLKQVLYFCCILVGQMCYFLFNWITFFFDVWWPVHLNQGSNESIVLVLYRFFRYLAYCVCCQVKFGPSYIAGSYTKFKFSAFPSFLT